MQAKTFDCAIQSQCFSHSVESQEKQVGSRVGPRKKMVNAHYVNSGQINSLGGATLLRGTVRSILVDFCPSSTHSRIINHAGSALILHSQGIRPRES